MELFEKVDALVDRAGLTAVLVAVRNKVTLMGAAPAARWTLDERERLKEVEGLLDEALDELAGTDIDAPDPDDPADPSVTPAPAGDPVPPVAS